MTTYAVTVDKRAVRQLEKIITWWREHRPAAPELVVTEFAGAIALLAVSPKVVGARYQEARDARVRRLLLPRSEYHAYLVDDDRKQVRVLAIWGARRGRGPRL